MGESRYILIFKDVFYVLYGLLVVIMINNDLLRDFMLFYLMNIKDCSKIIKV